MGHKTMFTKLRNKFLILNMSMTSMVMITAFAIIYFMTCSNIQSDIQSRLNVQSEMRVQEEETGVPEEKGTGGTKAAHAYFSADDPLSFHIEVDANGDILHIYSPIDMPEKFYGQAAELAWGNKKNKTAITLDGKQWRYHIAPVRIRVIQENGEHVVTDKNRFNIVFLDVTAYAKTLHQLLTTLISVGVITILVIFAASLYFANRAITPLTEAWEKQKQFVGDASHELKTPLSIITANHDVLMANRESTIKSQIKWLNYMKIGMDRMAKLISDLLSLAEMEDVKLKTNKAPFNLSDEINDVIRLMEAGAVKKGITLSSSIQPDIIIKSDAELVRQVIAILFDNAVKYTNENGRIDVSLSKSKHRVTCSIRNSGKGIDPQDVPKVFDRFFRADRSRTHENGSFGLGLSIAKAIMDRLGGEIHVESKKGEYTTFTVIF
jgi:signal transduction histidine kinase